MARVDAEGSQRERLRERGSLNVSYIHIKISALCLKGSNSSRVLVSGKISLCCGHAKLRERVNSSRVLVPGKISLCCGHAKLRERVP